MFDSQRKTANLFDKDTATIYEATINSTGSWTTGNGATVRIPVMPSTTYTLHTNSLQSVFRATEITSDTLPPVDGNLIIRSSNINSCTFTTSENAKYIVFQAGVDTTQQWIQELMLNEGSTPLPYEPYGWVHSLRKLGTSTDTITTLPADVYANDTTATVGLKGDMSQSPQPSPTTPIQPQECGERTGNLFDGELKQGSVAESSSVGTGYDDVTDYQSTKRVVTSNPVVCHGATVTWNNSKYWICICYFDKDLGYIGNTSQGFETWITTGTHEMHKYPYAAIAVRRTDNADFIPEDTSDLNLVVDNYKIPISSANTTTPVYLGEVQSTRQIKKYEFTGQENITLYGASTTRVGFYFNRSDAILNGRTTGICSHFKPQATPSGSTIDGVTFGANDKNFYFTFSADSVSAYNLTDITSIKTYLAQQYAAGTPVCVWYVLATPTTGIANEPLRKIGDYADTVSGISIPTISGKDTFDVETTLKPSEVSLTYTGWHDAEVKEWDGSEWQ